MSVFPKRDRTVVGTTNRDSEIKRQSSRFIGSSGNAFESACLTEMTGLMKRDPSRVLTPRQAMESHLAGTDRGITAVDLLSGSRQRTLPTRLQDEVKGVPSLREQKPRLGDVPTLNMANVITPRTAAAAAAAAPLGSSRGEQVVSAEGAKILRNAFYPGIAVANIDPTLPPQAMTTPQLPRNTRFGSHPHPDTTFLVQAQSTATNHFLGGSDRFNRDILGKIRNETLQTKAVREVAAQNAAAAKAQSEKNCEDYGKEVAAKAAARLETKSLMLQEYQHRQSLKKYPT